MFARSGLLEMDETPLEISCWRMGPWTGRGADVSAVLDLMIHDIDLMHRLVPGAVAEVDAFGRAERGRHADEVSAAISFENGTLARLHASRIAHQRSRGMQLVYVDGIVEIDFVTREIRNTTRRPLGEISFEIRCRNRLPPSCARCAAKTRPSCARKKPATRSKPRC